MGISHSAGGSCRVLTLLRQHQPKLVEILEKGNESDKDYTTKLLLSLSQHSCIQCTDMEWVADLLKKDVEAESEKVNLEVTKL